MSVIEISAAFLAVGLLCACLYKKAFRFACVSLFLAGVGLSGIILSLIGGVHWSILGVGIAFPLLVALAVMFWFEVIKKHKNHKVRSPIVALAFGVMLTTLGGSLGASVAGGVQHLDQRTGNTVDQLVNSNGR